MVEKNGESTPRTIVSCLDALGGSRALAKRVGFWPPGEIGDAGDAGSERVCTILRLLLPSKRLQPMCRVSLKA